LTIIENLNKTEEQKQHELDEMKTGERARDKLIAIERNEIEKRKLIKSLMRITVKSRSYSYTN
jgi:hypothetical protein